MNASGYNQIADSNMERVTQVTGQLEKLTRALSDIGCQSDAIEKAERLWKANQTVELIRHLRLCRCSLMDDLHMIQRRVDCMDVLIRQVEKTIPEK